MVVPLFFMKTFDIDAFVPQKRKIKVDGVEHECLALEDLSYKEILELFELDRAVSAQESVVPRRGILGFFRRARSVEIGDDQRRVRALAAQINTLVPTLTIDQLLSMPIRKLGTIFTFIRTAHYGGDVERPTQATTTTETRATD